MVRLRFALMTVAAMLMTAFALPAAAQDIGKGPHVPATLIAETDTPAPGSSVTLAFASVPQKGWHAYWENPGDAGIVTQLDWTLPAGVSAGPMVYPVPDRLDVAGIMNYVYEAPFTTFVELKIPAGLAPGTKLPIRVKTDYLVCTLEICVPESDAHALTLTVGDGAISPERRAQFDGWRKALPRPLGSRATYQIADGKFRIAVPFPAGVAAGDAYFFPLTLDILDQSAPQKVTRAGDTLVIETGSKSASGEIEGVLATGDGAGYRVRAVPGTVAAPVAGEAGAAAAGGDAGWLGAALAAFGAAVLGGVLLNIMPCVFPILSLKALSLAKANAGDGNPRGEAIAYAAGVILVCLALGATMLALRAGGAAVGWAFQLQDPRVILILLILTGGIAFNLAGLFEVATPGVVNRAAAKGAGGAFATGALAAFIATPCTGPFMGAAMGAALVLPTIAALAVFAGLGLGIALPFLLIGFVPALRRRLPKPGAWMAAFRRVLSIPMFLTAIALAWVLGRQTGVDGMTFGLLVLLALGLVLWRAGVRQKRGLGFGLAALVVLVAMGAAGLWGISRFDAPKAAASAAPAGAETFSEARLAALRAEGRPVFAYFTADWCLTCKVNEKSAIETAAVRTAFDAAGVAVLVGDWTDGDPALGRFLEANGRAGVPLYLWYKPGADAPQVLPQALTQAMLRDLAGGGSAG